METYEKREVREMIAELRNLIYEIEEIGWRELKESEDYDDADIARNKAIKLLQNIEEYIDIVPLP